MKIIKIDPKNFNEGDVDLLSNALLEGKVLVLATDTVPGLIADASNCEAVERIFDIKKRPDVKRLPVFVADIDMAKEISEIDSEAEKEMNEKWPGAYTFVLKRKKYERELYGVDAETIALRIPDYPLLNKILEKTRIPLVQTSVNISGTPFLVQHDELMDYLNSSDTKPDIVVDVGVLPEAKPSTVVDLTKAEKDILRN